MRFLVGDIGGTKTLLAIFTKVGGEFTLERKEKFLSGEYQGLEEIIERFLVGGGGKIDGACFAFAGPVEGNIGYATNLPWIVDGGKIEKRFLIDRVFMLNDLVLHAEGIRALGKEDFCVLNAGVPADPKANQALMSAGTGLGESIIIGGDYSIYSEGGHCDFAPRDEKEVELFLYLKKRYSHVSYERVVSGPGIVNLYQFLIDRGYEKKSSFLPEVRASLISHYGVSKKCPACYHALLWFSSLYGAEAGNLALKAMALGGVFIGGGIAPAILPIFKEGAFMKGFIDKGRFSSIVEKIPVKIVLQEETALNGSLLFLQKTFFL